MIMDKSTLKKRYESTAETFQKKGNREWAQAKNGDDGCHYQKARDAYARAKRNREKADNL